MFVKFWSSISDLGLKCLGLCFNGGFCCLCRIVEDNDMDCERDSNEVEVFVPELDEKDKKSYEEVQKIIEGLIH